MDIKNILKKIGKECSEGEVQNIGLNYWFPENNRTLWRIIPVIPLFLVRSDEYYDWSTDSRKVGQRILCVALYMRKRNMKFFSSEFLPFIFKAMIRWKPIGEQITVLTRELSEDMGWIWQNK